MPLAFFGSFANVNGYSGISPLFFVLSLFLLKLTSLPHGEGVAPKA
jgi:hypothetical protein